VLIALNTIMSPGCISYQRVLAAQQKRRQQLAQQGILSPEQRERFAAANVVFLTRNTSEDDWVHSDPFGRSALANFPLSAPHEAEMWGKEVPKDDEVRAREYSDVKSSGRMLVVRRKELKNFAKRTVLTIFVDSHSSNWYAYCFPKVSGGGMVTGTRVTTGVDWWGTVQFSMPGVRSWRYTFKGASGIQPPPRPIEGGDVCEVLPLRSGRGIFEYDLFRYMYRQIGPVTGAPPP
jgi:hypothetical protein